MINYDKRFVKSPQEGCDWAEKMILNPAIIKDPVNEDTLHMLFRATGPYPGKQIAGKPLPFPIFLGYAVSKDSGETWNFDFETPALAPALEYEKEKLFTHDINGNRTINYANGCIEDPRLFYFENKLYLSAACRVFPPGPYWDHDDPVQCMPEWALTEDHGLGRAVTDNTTVSLMYEVDLDALSKRNYENAFSYVCPMHNPDISDDRDVFLFPRKLKIDGKEKVVCIHRPKEPNNYEMGIDIDKPSIFLAAADSFFDLAGDNVERHVLAAPEYEWEKDRVGASWAPIELDNGEWLLPYHAKQDSKVGYTQSFMILKENDSGFPSVIHRPSDRMMFADEAWELDGDFTTPCMFTCSGVKLNSGKLLMGYGAADQKIGIAEVQFDELIEYVRQYPVNS